MNTFKYNIYSPGLKREGKKVECSLRIEYFRQLRWMKKRKKNEISFNLIFFSAKNKNLHKIFILSLVNYRHYVFFFQKINENESDKFGEGKSLRTYYNLVNIYIACKYR